MSGKTLEQIAAEIETITGHRPTRGTLSKWELDRIKNPADISEHLRRALADVLNVDHDYLVYGKGDRKSFDRSAFPFSEKFVKVLDTQAPNAGKLYVTLPIFATTITMTKRGTPQVNFERLMGTISVENDDLADMGSDVTNLRTVVVEDDSMARTLHPGDKAVVDISKRSIADNAVYAMAYGNKLRIKRLFWTADGRLRITSDNPAHREEIIEKNDISSIYIIGQVVFKKGVGGLL